MKQFPARTQSEDALTQQLAALGLKDGRVTLPAAGGSTDETDSPEPSPEDEPDLGGDATV